MAVVRAKTEPIPFDLINQFLKFFADANLSDDNSKNFELFEEINIPVDLKLCSKLEPPTLKRPNGSSKSATDNEDETLMEEDLSSPLSPSDGETKNSSKSSTPDLKLKNLTIPKKERKRHWPLMKVWSMKLRVKNFPKFLCNYKFGTPNECQQSFDLVRLVLPKLQLYCPKESLQFELRNQDFLTRYYHCLMSSNENLFQNRSKMIQLSIILVL